ncbi:hypothetical protein ACFYS8_17670 [Kitasatospora sp. NPDC004615]|uniref:hypothetical protein n=1 Tax=Kitasatospora sp. NPDC004615 TaxID=3364017 RepID=UPI00368DD64F
MSHADSDFDKARTAVDDLYAYFIDDGLVHGLLTDRRAAQAEIADKTLAISIREQDPEADVDDTAVQCQLRQHALDRAARIDIALDYADASRLWARLLVTEYETGIDDDPKETAVRATRLKDWSTRLIDALRDASSTETPRTAQAALAPLLDRDAILRRARENAADFARGLGVEAQRLDWLVALREEYADLAATALGIKTLDTQREGGI